MKKRIMIMIVTILCFVSIVVGMNLLKPKTIFVTTYYFGMGSRRVKINENGKVYDDLEIEEPNHKENYKFVKKLSEEQLNSLKDKIQTISDDSKLNDFVIQLVYSVEEFDNFGGY